MSGTDREGPAPSGRAEASRSRWSARSLGARLVAAQVLVAVTLLGLSWLAQQQLQRAEERLLRVYDHRVSPLRNLWEVSDEFAIDFVDAVHKVASASLAPDVGAARLAQVSANAERRFREAEALMTSPEEKAELLDLREQLNEAQRSLSEARNMMLHADLRGLDNWRRVALYARVDPLTARMQRALASDVDAAHSELLSLRLDINNSARQGIFGLALAGCFAIAVGLFVAARFLSSLRQIARVAQAASAGNLHERVGLSGSDELAEMARHIDHMIDAIEHSQEELSQQSISLRASEAEARAASLAKSAFLSSVSHELRTPLNVILGYAQVLERDREVPASHLKGLERIREAGTHLLELIDDLLGLTRLEAGALTLKPVAFSPRSLLDDLTRMFEPAAREKGLVFQAESRGKLPTAVSADRRRLLQVLLNLTGNAIKFTQRGRVSVSASYADERLAFEVRDTGPGISVDEQRTLFQTFSQGEQGQRSGEGTGLGLYISQSLVRALGGQIALESELGRGSCFAFSVSAPLGEENADPSSPRGARTRRLGVNAKVLPMLVVDDRAANREVLRALLEDAGFRVAEAGNGNQALRWLEAEPASLVWLDLKMPEMDGFQTLAALRQHPARKTTLVVAITASAVDVDARRATALGFDGLVVKPFRAEEILDLVEQLLHIEFVEASSVVPPTGSEPIDVARLSPEVQKRLLDLLLIGDVRAASSVVDAQGVEFASLRQQIESFRTDALLAKLRSLTRES